MGKGVSKTSKGERERGGGVPNDRRVEFTSLMRPRLHHPSDTKSKSFLQGEEEEEDSFSRSIAFISSSVLNSLFPRLSSNYFSREAKKKKKKKLWRSSIPFGNERERVKGERDSGERLPPPPRGDAVRSESNGDI